MEGVPGDLELVTSDPGEGFFRVEGVFWLTWTPSFACLPISLSVLVSFLLDGSPVTVRVFQISLNSV